MITARPYGALRHVRTDIRFRIPAEHSYRSHPELGGGIFFDSASYWLQALQSTAGIDGVTGTGKSAFDGPHGADTSFHAALRSADGWEATLTCEVGDRHAGEVEFVFETASVRIRNLFRPIAGALPLNLAIRHESGDTQIRSFAAVSYYDAQLDRIHGLFSCAGDELAAARARIDLMVQIYAAARQEASVSSQ
jgi:predicted dehydrogenase